MAKHTSHSETRVDSRSVFQPNAKTRKSFRGRVIGCYQRTGPNAWDDYQLVTADGGPLDMFPAVRIQVEPTGARFRMRKGGKVMVVEWAPTHDEQADIGEGEEPRAAFLHHCVENFRNKGGMGVTAFIAKTLGR